MKRFYLALILVVLMVSGAYADERCYSSGLLAADAFVGSTGGGHCLCGVELIPAAADSTLIVYKGTSAVSGKEIFKTSGAANTSPNGFLGGTCIDASGGIYGDVGGAGAGYIIWYR
jgi:hypothetical protein